MTRTRKSVSASAIFAFIAYIAILYSNYAFASENELCTSIQALARANNITGALGGKTSSTITILRHIKDQAEHGCGPRHRFTGLAYLKLAKEELKYEDYDTAEKLSIAALQVFSKPIGRSKLYRADTLALLAMIRITIGDASSARSINDQSLSIRKKARNVDRRITSENLLISSLIFSALDGPESALPYAENAYKSMRTSKARKYTVGERKVYNYNEIYLRTLNVLVNLYISTGQVLKGEEVVRILTRTVTDQPEVRFQELVGDILHTSSRCAHLLGNNKAALERINRTLAVFDEGYSVATPKYARALILKARIISALSSHDTNSESKIRELLDRGMSILDDVAEKTAFISPLAAKKKLIDIRKAALDAIGTFDDKDLPITTSRELMLEYGFRLAQLLSSTESAKSISKANLRKSLNDEKLRQLIRTHQNLLEKELSLRDKLIEIDFANKQADNSVLNEFRETSDRIREIQQSLKYKYPAFSSKFNLRSYGLKELQNNIIGGEALLMYLVEKEATYLWVVNEAGITYKKINISEEKLSDRISRLRKSTKFIEKNGSLTTKSFSSVSAFKLYEWLIKPIKLELKSTHDLLIVPSGVLYSLPFPALITHGKDKSIVGYNDLAKAHWLISDFSISILPSIRSINSRNIDFDFQDSNRFLGFGDPAIGNITSDSSSVSDSLRSMNIKTIFRDISALPDTAVELRTISKLFDQGHSALYLQKDASEYNLKQLDLQIYDVISFATHGLLGNMDNYSLEPALVLTPNDFTSSDSDGLLTTSEISLLNIDAQLVILSACETAVMKRSGSAGISELASAFFFAGSKAILASHWPVESKTTSQLVSDLMKKALRQNNLRLNRALRESMIDMIRSPINKHHSHPAYWAAFSLYST